MTQLVSQNQDLHAGCLLSGVNSKLLPSTLRAILCTPEVPLVHPPLYRRERGPEKREDSELVRKLDHSQGPSPSQLLAHPTHRLHLSASLCKLAEQSVQGGSGWNKTDSTPGRRAGCYESLLLWDLTCE